MTLLHIKHKIKSSNNNMHKMQLNTFRSPCGSINTEANFSVEHNFNKLFYAKKRHLKTYNTGY